ncbi:M48 family metallopeptidase [Bradyrhizobium sp. U87765 SZCCT0131]|uniref:M48 family metalloprotease n=1 Tax=Bradyrhizobium sp. U87765 SZCCT0109 TaxID=2807656 RepID=UPI001BA45558|nr:M48 family metallopeptidase [Bradyrhizobium sp. U87765 SZCCT0131]MBR1263180.1 M48 family metallopeptidase [Bradyrhizobium sp. U87765 SZCCT0134]MBR1306937.1 M48 family metallopeptidase [Bradyrhizobium sp. U87765 SZCCT0110]MBR1323436.1 M48 family metallopeptidase [Bradyrhizobium sp. U87765 SZCCT0109]MBR1345891.1 M48 family metallopeptidase [Bradyrhizobium sp. U87765 SZCCT0048]
MLNPQHRSSSSPRPRGRSLATRLTALVTAAALACSVLPARAQDAKGPPTLRDAEIEQLLRDYTRPILRTAGLEKQNIQVVIINDRSFNAFVADGRRIFVNYGALLDAQTPNQIIGVLAHETGHLAGGHLAKLREQLAQAQTQMIIAMLLGVGAMVAGAKSNSSGASQIGAAAISAPQEAIRRNLLSYQRQQEENADRAGVKFLNATGQSAKGMYDTFKRFADQTLFSSQGSDPYLMSHPMPAERVAALEQLARSSPYWDKKDDAALQLRHDLMRAKIAGFMDRPDTVSRKYPPSNTSLPARYARAISTYRHGDLRMALAMIDDLIREQPNNPYFHELRGQALLEGGRPAEAIAPLRKAVQISGNSALIEMLLGQALVASDNKAYADEAIAILRAALTREPEAPIGYTQLAMAYGRKGNYAEADLASAQAAFLRGDNKTARELATRAKTRFAVGTPGWVKADDIVSAKPLPGQKN